jgi:hypothetical protein
MDSFVSTGEEVTGKGDAVSEKPEQPPAPEQEAPPVEEEVSPAVAVAVEPKAGEEEEGVAQFLPWNARLCTGENADDKSLQGRTRMHPQCRQGATPSLCWSRKFSSLFLAASKTATHRPNRHTVWNVPGGRECLTAPAYAILQFSWLISSSASFSIAIFCNITLY